MTARVLRYVVPALLIAIALSACAAVVLWSDGSYADVHWDLDDQHNLSVYGSGTISDGPHDEWADAVSLTIADGVNGIGNEAFGVCTNLTTVTIQGDMDSIGDKAFFGCASMKSVTIQGNLGTLGDQVFYDCYEMTTFTVGGSVGSIGDRALAATGLTTFTVGGDVGSIAFAGLAVTSLSELYFPGNVGDIGTSAFADNHSLRTFTVAGSTGDIGLGAFENCGLMTFTVNGSVGDIGKQACEFCGELLTFTVNGSAGSIGDYAFNNCPKLTSVTIKGDFGPSIGTDAFFNCTALSSFRVPAGMTSITDDAFQTCTSLKTVYVPCDNPLKIKKGGSDNGAVALHADQLVRVHYYSVVYDWSEDGKSCTVDIFCAKMDIPDNAFAGDVVSKVLIEPTETEKGTTEYSVSGTYDGFDYSSTKDVQDIPSTGSPDDDKVLEHELIGAGIILMMAVGVLLAFMRRK